MSIFGVPEPDDFGPAVDPDDVIPYPLVLEVREVTEDLLRMLRENTATLDKAVKLRRAVADLVENAGVPDPRDYPGYWLGDVDRASGVHLLERVAAVLADAMDKVLDPYAESDLDPASPQPSYDPPIPTPTQRSNDHDHHPEPYRQP